MSYSKIILLKETGQSQGFTLVQAALDASTGNDIVMVYPGTYAEAVTVASGKNLIEVGVVNYTSITVASGGKRVNLITGKPSAFFEFYNLDTSGLSSPLMLKCFDSQFNQYSKVVIAATSATITLFTDDQNIFLKELAVNFSPGDNLAVRVAEDSQAVLTVSLCKNDIIVGLIHQYDNTGFGDLSLYQVKIILS